MATKIVTKNSSTASAVPTASDLVQGELAVNVADKRLFTEDNGGSIVELGTNPSTIDINAGSIDGTTIGASSASTGAFTTLTASGLTVDTNTLYVDATNNRVGIGTTLPSNKMSITGFNEMTLGFPAVSGGASRSGIKPTVTGAGAGQLEFLVGGDNNNEATTVGMAIDSSGNVGIGTSSPSYELDIQSSSGDAEVAITGSTTNNAVLKFENVTSNTLADIYADNSKNLIFRTNSTTERMRIDSSGNVGIGESNPQELLHLTATTPVFRMQGGSRTYQQFVSGTDFVIRDVNAGLNRVTLDSSGNLLVGRTASTSAKLHLENATDVHMDMNSVGDNRGKIGSKTNDFYIGHSSSAANIIFKRNIGSDDHPADSGNETMRIDSSGRTLFGNTDSLTTKPAGVICPIGYVGRAGTTGSSSNVFNVYWTGSAAQLYIDTSNLGTISTSSDYRIKKNINPMESGAISRVLDLKPITYELTDYKELFKSDGVVREGFIAHEVQEVIPSGADGAKDEEDCIQSLRVDAIVAVLTKAVQEQQTLIESLTTRIAALEE